MIIFTTKPEEVVNMLVMTGKEKQSNIVCYNFTSYSDMFTILKYLTPPCKFSIEEEEFSIRYLDYILNNDLAMIEFMQILIPVFNDGNSVIIHIGMDSIYKELLNESLADIISMRYGYSCYFVEEYFDVVDLKEPSFSYMGIQNMDSDIKRINQLCGNIINSEDIEDD